MFDSLISSILGRNTRFTSKDTITSQLLEKRPLPVGMTEFEEWSDRIISGTGLTATAESQKFALANMILHLAPTEAFKEDGYFINSLRKFAANEIADAMRNKLRDDAKARLAAEEAAKVQVSEPASTSDVTPAKAGGVHDVLEKSAL